MKIGVPSMKPGGLEAMVSAHFGHCELYTVIELEGKKIKKVSTIGNEGEHDCSLPVKLLEKEGVKAVLIGGIGRGPLLSFKEKGIDVYVGASGNVKDAIADYQEGFLKIATLNDVCTGCHND
jgi:predicted Fe-Mo cluster-binding NifX family protein